MPLLLANRKAVLRWLPPLCGLLPCYLLPFLLLPAKGFWINDGGCKYIQTVSLIRNGYASADIPWPGRALDPELEFQPLAFPFGQKIDGKLYGYYSTAFSLLASGPYLLWGFRGLYVPPLLGALALAPAVWIMAGKLPGARLGQPISLLLVFLCSPVWFYSVSFWEHVPALAFLSWATVLALSHVEKGDVLSLAGAAALCAGAIGLRDDLYLFSAALFGATVFRKRNLKAAAAAGLVGACCLSPLWIAQWLSTGSPLGHHLSSVSPLMNGWRAFVAERWIAFKALLLDAHAATWISLLLSSPCLVLWSWSPAEVRIRGLNRGRLSLAWACMLAAAAGWGHWTAQAPLDWMMRTNGVFASAPFLVLGFHRVSNPGRSATPSSLLLRASLAFSLLYAFLSPATSLVGIHWGCRHLLPVFVLVGVAAGSFIGHRWEKRDWGVPAWSAVVFLVALSFLLQARSLALLHRRKSFSEELNQRVAERQEEVVVAVNWYFPQELGPVFFEKSVFLAQTPEREALLLDRLESQGVKRILRVGSHPRRRRDAVTWARMRDEMGFFDLELQSLELRR